jgi:hypothetical protein
MPTFVQIKHVCSHSEHPGSPPTPCGAASFPHVNGLRHRWRAMTGQPPQLAVRRLGSLGGVGTPHAAVRRLGPPGGIRAPRLTIRWPGLLGGVRAPAPAVRRLGSLGGVRAPAPAVRRPGSPGGVGTPHAAAQRVGSPGGGLRPDNTVIVLQIVDNLLNNTVIMRAGAVPGSVIGARDGGLHERSSRGRVTRAGTQDSHERDASERACGTGTCERGPGLEGQGRNFTTGTLRAGPGTGRSGSR